MSEINVIGAGLAGCEAAFQIAKRGQKVNLYEMKPKKFSPAHKSSNLCELVCSNSFKADRIENASGLLKEELRRLGSVVLECADKCRVPAGGALAVDREQFSDMVTRKIKENENINLISEEIKSIPKDGIHIIATGPLTSESLSEDIKSICGGNLSFFDAAAPIVTFDSIDREHCYYASRYGRGNAEDYLNCPLNKEQYEEFYNNLVNAERAPIHDFDVKNPKVYEGCMPIEVAAQRGYDTLRYGPMKPVGLRDPRTGERPFAVVQMRRENREGSLYNMVGFQTNLKFGEQRRVFSIIPGLKNLEIVRYGVMHRNTFISSPGTLNADYSMISNGNIFFAGQITGVEGYMESVSSGLVAGINAYRVFNGLEKAVFPKETMIGALSSYISDREVKDFQPMGANFGILPGLEEQIRDKKTRYRALSERSLQILESGSYI